MGGRANGMTITLFVAPQALLMQLPFVGPLVYVPMQSAAAWLLDMLLRQQPAQGEIAAPPEHAAYASHHAPTKPPPMAAAQPPALGPAQQGWRPSVGPYSQSPYQRQQSAGPYAQDPYKQQQGAPAPAQPSAPPLPVSMQGEGVQGSPGWQPAFPKVYKRTS